MTSKKALITGITGMDGRLLAHLLLEKEYEVFGLYRNNPSRELTKIDGITYIESDLSNLKNLPDLFSGIIFDEIYNLGGQTFINFGWENPEYTIQVNCTSVITFLEYIRKHSPSTKFFNASSSEVFSDTLESPQTESTLYCPNNLYGSSKTLANNIIKNYREKHGIFACSGILYTHEDVTRDEYYVSKKITSGVAKIHLGISGFITLGDLNAKRDWMSAKDAVRAMWVILNQEEARDYIISSGISRTIEDFLSSAFSWVGIEDWKKYILIDRNLMRQNRNVEIVGNNSMLKSIGWEKTVDFNSMIGDLVSYEIDKLKNKDR